MKTKTVLTAALFSATFSLTTLFSPVFSQPSNPAIRIGEPFRIYPSNVNQIEPAITRHPSNPNILFASALTFNSTTAFVSEGVYVTTNRGVSWRGNDTCTGTPLTFHRGDPSVTIDKDGRFLLTRWGFPIGPGVYAHTSTNNGISWSSQRTILADASDRAALISDVVPTSANYGSSYVAWVRQAPPYPVFFSSTSDGGTSWTTPAAVNAPSPRSQGAELALGPNGRVNLCWARVIGSSPFTEDFIGFATSTTGGAPWAVTETAIDINGIQGILPAKNNIRVNGLPKIDTDRTGGPRNGWIYIVTAQRNLSPAGSDPDVILYRSTNDGQSWSAGIRVNQDALNNGKTQLFPAIHVDDGGGVNILYYDDRATRNDSLSVYLSRSTNGGTTWSDYQINTKNYAPRPISGLDQGHQGDNIALSSSGNTLLPLWMDNTSGIYQVWINPIDLTTLSVKSEDALSTTFELRQNFPNPFNPTTTFSFVIPGSRSTFVSLKVFDMLGREVASLVNGNLDAGKHERIFDAEGLSSGLYFYRLHTGDLVATRKMLLLR